VASQDQTAKGVREMSAPPDFSTDSDADLLGYMACRADDPDVARAAWAEFFVRHREYLFACAARWRGEAEDVVAETFRRVMDAAPTFDPGRLLEPADHVRVRRQVRAWLGMVMNRTAVEMLRCGEIGSGPAPAGVADLPAPRAAPDDPEREAKIAAVREAVESMTPREQDILWAVAHWGGPERLPLPADVLAGICRRFGTTPENVRKIRERAIKKVREGFAALARPEAAPTR
jgi:RNA polymerase sigma factor (sigma-70 family)